MLKARVLVGYFGQVTFLSLQFLIYKWGKRMCCEGGDNKQKVFSTGPEKDSVNI